MQDSIDETFGHTTAVMTKLLEQAKEATATGASRRSFFAKTAALASATTLGVAGAGLLQPIAAHAALAADDSTPDTAQSIAATLATAEALATTFYVYALASAHLPDVNSTANRNYFQAAAVQEFEHLTILEQLGGAPLTTTFYFPENMFSDEFVFFPTASTLEDTFISAYIAAAREFSGAVTSGITKASPDTIGLLVQTAGIECEHRALLRVAAGLNPPNNRIIESALIKRVSDAVAPLTPYLNGGPGFVGPFALPTAAEVNEIASPYTFRSFPKYTFF